MKENISSSQERLLKDFINRRGEFDVGNLGKTLTSAENDTLRKEFERLMRMTDLTIDEKRMWDNIQSRIKKKSRKIWLRYLKYAVAVILPLYLGYWAWMTSQDGKSTPVTVVEMITPGKPRAYLQLSGGEQLELSSAVRGTVFVERGSRIRVDSTGMVSYISRGSGKEMKETVYNTIVVPRSGEYKLELADGTRVWLNSESELRYPVEFQGARRDVYLKGEGYFEVAPDTKKPFQVLVDDMMIRVLGTSFNVNAYRDQGGILTTLVTGKVNILNHAGEKLVEMRPDQQVDFRNGVVTVREVDSRKYVAWINGDFYFEEMPLENIMEQLCRWYDIEVFFTRQDLKSYKFTGVIRKDFTAEQIFKVIEKTTCVKFRVRGRCVTVNYE